MEIASRVDRFPPKLYRCLRLDHLFRDTALVLGVGRQWFEANTLSLQDALKEVVVFSSSIVAPESSYFVAKSFYPCVGCLECCCASLRLLLGRK